MEREYKLNGEYIELFKLLKITNIAATGGHGKILIEDGEVTLNGEIEYRKRAKIRVGNVISCNDFTIKII